MAAVEGIPDQGTDVIQKHVPQNSNGDSCPETVLSNGESNETRSVLLCFVFIYLFVSVKCSVIYQKLLVGHVVWDRPKFSADSLAWH